MSSFERWKFLFTKKGEPSQQLRIPPSDGSTTSLPALVHLLASLRKPFHFAFHDLIIWRINTSFMNFFLQTLIFFIVYINIFMVFAYWVVSGYWRRNQRECINVWTYDEQGSSDFGSNMEIAFELSWITCKKSNHPFVKSVISSTSPPLAGVSPLSLSPSHEYS